MRVLVKGRRGMEPDVVGFGRIRSEEGRCCNKRDGAAYIPNPGRVGLGWQVCCQTLDANVIETLRRLSMV
jgi:hypothetical protein